LRFGESLDQPQRIDARQRPLDDVVKVVFMPLIFRADTVPRMIVNATNAIEARVIFFPTVNVFMFLSLVNYGVHY